MDKVLQYAKKRGIIRVRDAISQGIHPEYLRRLCEKGLLVKMGRGTYIPADSEMPPNILLKQLSRKNSKPLFLKES